MHTVRETDVSESGRGPHDLIVPLEGYIPTDHIVEQHPQGPDCGRTSVVTVSQDPFGGAVHTSTYSTETIIQRINDN